MRVSLVNPRIGNTPQPPLGILYIAAMLRNHDHAVQVFDPSPDDVSFVTAIKEFQPDLIGISIMTTQVKRATEVITLLRAAIPNARYVGGGIHPTALPAWSLEQLKLDIVVIGEGDYALLDIGNALQNGNGLHQIPGIAFFDEHGGVVQTHPRPFIEDIDLIPSPARDLLDFNRYLRPPGNIRGYFLKRATAVMSGRGCPFSCNFCSSHTLFGKTVRMRSVENMLHEIDELVQTYHIDGFWFVDDTLLENHEWTYQFCEQLKQRSYNLIWGCQAHVLRINESILEAMRDAGCRQIEFGVESGSPAVLKRMKKSSTPELISEAFRLTKKVGIRTLANFILGNPGETVADLEMSLHLAKRIKPNHVVVTFATPLPGSCLFEEALEKGWISKTEPFTDSWLIRQTESPSVVMTLDAETLKHFRSQFDNHFFWKNHSDYFKYPGFILTILTNMLKHPVPHLNGFLTTLRTRRLSHFIETIWDQLYRI